MLHILKRHPIPMAARFEQAVALTYAFPRQILDPLVSPGLELDNIEDIGFLGITTVQTCELRPAFLPAAFGRNYSLTSYRLFTRFTTSGGVELRGLQTLRSDTNDFRMVKWGNRLTRYGYRYAEMEYRKGGGALQVDVQTPHAEADLQITADIDRRPGKLPKQSPFLELDVARRFVAPLPHTLDYEPESASIIVVEARRTHWEPQLVDVQVQTNTFLQASLFRQSAPVLASAFYLTDVSYRWERGRREPLGHRSIKPVRT